MYHNTLHTHVACIGMGTSTDRSADLQSDWDVQIPPQIINWTYSTFGLKSPDPFPCKGQGLGARDRVWERDYYSTLTV